jgi:hypothetical protein
MFLTIVMDQEMEKPQPHGLELNGRATAQMAVGRPWNPSMRPFFILNLKARPSFDAVGKILLAIIAIALAVLIGALVFAAFTL